MLTRGDLKNSIFLVGAEGISRGLAFVLTVFIARELGVVAFGAYSTAVSFVFLFSVFIEIGLSTYVFREVARDEQKASQYIVNALVIQAILSIIVGVIVLLAAVVLQYSLDTRSAIALFWVWMVGLSLGHLIRVVFKARQRMGLEALANVFENGTRFVLVLVALQLGYGVVGIAVASIVSAILMMFLSLLMAFGRYVRFPAAINATFMVDLVKAAWPFALSIIANVLMYRLSTVILSVIKGDYAVGIFDASFKIMMSLFFIPGLICQVFFSKMSQYATSDHTKFSATVFLLVKYIFLLVYPFLMGLFVFAPQIIPIIYTEEFFPTVTVLQILVWVNVFNAGTYIGMYALNAAGYEKTVMQAMFLGVAIKFIISIALIMKISFTGAAIAALFSELIVVFWLFYHLYRKAAMPQLKVVLIKVASIVIVSFAGILLGEFLHLNGFVIYGLFSCLFVMMCGAFGLVTLKDLFRLQHLVFKKAYE